jgi:hypothetical protein
MGKLSLEQRSKRLSTKKNNKLKKDYPLFKATNILDSWFTTPVLEKKRLQRHDAAARKYLERLAKKEEENQAVATLIRENLRSNVVADVYSVLSLMRNRYPRSGEYSLSFWKKAEDIHKTLGYLFPVQGISVFGDHRICFSALVGLSAFTASYGIYHGQLRILPEKLPAIMHKTSMQVGTRRIKRARNIQKIELIEEFENKEFPKYIIF